VTLEEIDAQVANSRQLGATNAKLIHQRDKLAAV
jgi:hypothetical protein